MRTPLSSYCKILALAPCKDSGRCIKDSVPACGTVVIVTSELACDPAGGGGDGEGDMNAGNENCGRSGVKGAIPLLLDMLEGSEG